VASVSYEAVIKGRVQGVSFRASMREAALRHGVKGWVRNRGDGAVVALVQGEEAKVGELLDWARSGPPRAEVTSIETRKLEACPPQSGFRVLA
jgi:acylphosphatase